MTNTDTAKTLVQSAARSHLYFYWSRQFTFIMAMTGLFLSVGVATLEGSETGWDVARLFTLAMGVYLLGFSFKVIRIYHALEEVMHGDMKLLPSYITWIASSYLLLVIVGSGWIIHQLGRNPVIWGTPITEVAFVLGIHALGIAWQYQLKKAEEHGYLKKEV